MAYYDEHNDTVTIRVVYDGLGTAGKTTNIDQICEQFSAARTGDVYSPEVARGRTLYFDWLELRAGRVAGHKLRCQVISVPGQFVYVQRRWELLRLPDAIVAVCDSSRSALERSRLGIEFLQKTLTSREMSDVPVVYQANRQDADDALGPEELAAHLGLDPESVVPASAVAGVGVRSTLMKAIHAACARVNTKIESEGLQSLPRESETAEALYRRLKDLEDSEEFELGARIADEILRKSS